MARVVIPSFDALIGQVDPRTDTAFAPIPDSLTSRPGMHLRKDALDAYIAMCRSAQMAGLEWKVMSATRTFGHQKNIWERKWARPRYMGWSDLEKAQDILLYSSMPGSSRHHWGTDVDIYSLDPKDFESGTGAEVLEWMRNHAAAFGFAEVYSADSTRSGYQPEAWHWSYLPLSGPFLEAFNRYAESTEFPGFIGFEGAHTADSLRILERYVNGIAPL